MKLTEKQKIAKKYVLQAFDFEKCSKAMRMFDWKWHDKFFPSAQELKECASKLIDTLFEEDAEICSTGGLVARIDKDENLLILEFVLENGQGGRYL